MDVVHQFLIITTIANRGIFHYCKSVQQSLQVGANLSQVGAQQSLMSYLRKTNGLI